jgi:hypothetical protein|eukprot:gene6870-4946_t
MPGHGQKPAPQKAVNPEARLQASVARDLKLRGLEEHARHQSIAVEVARWENTLNQKDERANRKRREEQILEDSKVARINNTSQRRQRLEELYQMDELRYEAELNAKGLAFRRERL